MVELEGEEFMVPYKSKAQMGKFFAMEKRGQLPKGTAKEWADETPNIKKLPKHVKKSRSKAKKK